MDEVLTAMDTFHVPAHIPLVGELLGTTLARDSLLHVVLVVVVVVKSALSAQNLITEDAFELVFTTMDLHMDIEITLCAEHFVAN